MSRQPPGVGTGVSIASALPSRRPAMSSGRLTTSKVEASTNSPGCRTNGSAPLGSTGLGRSGWSSGVAVVLEHAEVPVQPDVDARGLDEPGRVRVEFHPARLDLGLDVPVGEEHPGNLPVPRRIRWPAGRAARTRQFAIRGELGWVASATPPLGAQPGAGCLGSGDVTPTSPRQAGLRALRAPGT